MMLYKLNLNKNIKLIEVIRLAFPVALQSALVAVLALADVLMVSDFGQEATAAVGIASKWHFVAIMVMAGLATANGTLVAQYWGKEDKAKAKSITFIAIRFGLLVMVPTTLILTLGSNWLMRLQTSDLIVITLGSDYLWYALPLLILTHIVIVVESTLRSSGDAITPLIIGSITIVLNIVLNYWLIKGGLGVPAMGVAGAALATTISRIVQLILIYAILTFRSHWLLCSNYGEVSVGKFRGLAVPLALNSILWALGTMSYQMIFGHMGTTELAVFSLLSPFESLCYSLFFGLSVACSVIIGNMLGRQEFDDALSTSADFIKYVMVLGVTCGFLLYLIKDTVIELLGLNQPDLLSIASPALTILSVAITLRMTNMIIINGSLRAGGDNQFCLKMDLFAMWVIGIPLCALAAYAFGFGFTTVFAMMLVEELIKLALCGWRYQQQRWLNDLT
ncbi:MATE family efflux transporter [Vibrio natriegens]|uniref:MATE family efflux transporter n=1 Tax=Vibrio natriegens TaxID=691 RepID=UPI000AE033D8|nr:MATE family efflux transporter [Vibrio natriegens]